MSVVRWDPFRDFMSLQNEVSRLFEHSWGTAEGRRRGVTPVWTPATDIYEKDGNLVVQADLPGLGPADVKVTIEDGDLIIRGERRFEEETKEENYYRVERRYGLFERVLQLPDDVDAEKIQADFADGVLTVTLPRKPQTKPKQIEVKVSAGSGGPVDTEAKKK
jgi:HSP20 family protein